MLTIISASYNALTAFGPEALERCVNSVATLPFPHEHLIMDGASTDDTVKFLRGMNLSGLQVSSERDNGIYDALNKGLSKACGDYVYILGLDDFIFDADALSVAYDRASRTNDDMVISPVRYSDGKIRPRRKSTIYDAYYRMAYPHQGLLVKLSRLRAIGGFESDYRISADYVSCLKLHMAGVRVRFGKRPYAQFSLGGISNEQRKNALDERSHFLSTVYVGANSEAVSGGVIPWRFVLGYLTSKNRFVRNMGLRALMRRFFATSHNRQERVYFLFGVPAFRRRRKKVG